MSYLGLIFGKKKHREVEDLGQAWLGVSVRIEAPVDISLSVSGLLSGTRKHPALYGDEWLSEKRRLSPQRVFAVFLGRFGLNDANQTKTLVTLIKLRPSTYGYLS